MDDIMMDRFLIDTSGHIRVGLDSNNTCLAVIIWFSPSMLDFAQEMGRCGWSTRFGEGNMEKHEILVTLEYFFLCKT